jgi:ABC-type antimicrobial peptide transport system permease subunit
MLHINRMLGFDKFHENYNRLYEVEANVTYFNGDAFPKELLSTALTDDLKQRIPEFDMLARVVNRNFTFVNGEKSFSEAGLFADETFFKMFTFPVVSGSLSSEQWGINSIVISKSMAGKFFGSADCIGQTLTYKDQNNIETVYKVSGVMNDIPAESSIRFEFVIPFSKFISENAWASDPGATATQVWSLLNKNATAFSINGKIKDLIKSNESTRNQELFLFPLREKVLYTYMGGRRVWGSMQYVVIAGVLGFSILLIACFNFINLAIAMNIRRYREAGIRKVSGAGRLTIIMQFMTETGVVVLTSLLIASELVKILLRGFNSMTNGNLRIDLSDAGTITGLVAITVLTILFSGLLPALYLSSSNPVDTLKGKMVTSHSFSRFRQGLIIFQFTMPVVFIICMMTIRVQDKFIRQFDLGFDRDKLLIIGNSKNLEAHEESFKNDLLAIPGIETVSYTSCIPSKGTPVTNNVSWEGKDAAEKLHFWSINTDFNYQKAVNINMTEGRYFDKSFVSDSASFVINDVAARVMKYENPVGRTMTLDGRKGTIIGVFRDFHSLDMAGPYTPTVISLGGNRNNILISFTADSYSSISESIRNIYRRYESEAPFNAILFSDLTRRTELTTISRVIGAAFIIALLLACLGLSGLASFTALSRTKEIGIKKINGASTMLIMRMLGKNYTRWLIISTIIAIPIAFLLCRMFLARFNFRADMPVWSFIAGPLIAYVLALSAVSLLSWRVASRNPVEALRYE